MTSLFNEHVLIVLFSNENIMNDIPILEIDCNVEFHDDEAIKKSMLDQVRIYTALWVITYYVILCESSHPKVYNFDIERKTKYLIEWRNTDRVYRKWRQNPIFRCEISSRNCRRQNVPKLRRKLKNWTTRAFLDQQHQPHHAPSPYRRFHLPISS